MSVVNWLAPAPGAAAATALPPVPGRGQGIGAAIGGAAGTVASGAQGIGAATAGGPVGLAIAGAIAIQRQVEESFRSSVAAIGESLRSVAALDARGIADGFSALTEKIPLVGPALAEVNKQIGSFADALTQTARRLASYSGELALAEAQADIRQTLGDLRRAQKLGTDLGRFEDARSRLSDVSQDLLADLLKPLIPLITNVLENLIRVVKTVEDLPTDTYNFFVDAINRLILLVETVANKLPGVDIHLGLLRRIAANTDKDEGLNLGFDPLADLLRTRLGASFDVRPAPSRPAIPVVGRGF